MARRKRLARLTQTDEAEVLKGLRACREAMVTVCRSVAIRTALYREAEYLIRTIDEVALLITGKQNYFRTEGHNTPGSEGG